MTMPSKFDKKVLLSLVNGSILALRSDRARSAVFALDVRLLDRIPEIHVEPQEEDKEVRAEALPLPSLLDTVTCS
jgi:hypothetical protein